MTIGTAALWTLWHEQADHRPALVLSSAVYNQKTGIMLCCPITSKIKGYPFEVIITDGAYSAVLSDQVKSLDWVARKAILKGKIPSASLEKVKFKIFTLLETPARR